MIMNWGATPQERAATLPCDALSPGAAVSADRAISIDAPPATVFAWLCQLRIAPYSYDLLDNIGRRSPRTRDPELTRLETGQRFMQMFTLRSFVEDEHITLQSGKVAVTYAVRPEGTQTRLHARVRFDGLRVVGWALALGDVVMMRKQLLTLRDLAEREAATSRS
ncbi:hypothetical protein ABQF34_05275 [Mycolicibacterium boenickei]